MNHANVSKERLRVAIRARKAHFGTFKRSPKKATQGTCDERSCAGQFPGDILGATYVDIEFVFVRKKPFQQALQATLLHVLCTRVLLHPFLNLLLLRFRHVDGLLIFSSREVSASKLGDLRQHCPLYGWTRCEATATGGSPIMRLQAEQVSHAARSPDYCGSKTVGLVRVRAA
jgi:hypothetical protein